MNTEKQGVFINGKAQIIEMLEYMTAPERETLIKNIRLRNPQLASELMEKSFSFEDLFKISKANLDIIFKYITPQILGLALKTLKPEHQREFLKIAPRSYAQSAYETMIQSYANEQGDSQKAQNKIISVFLNLVKKEDYCNLARLYLYF